MNKLFIRMFVTAMLSVSACISWAGVIASGSCGAEGDNLTWSLSDDYVLTISGSGEMEDYFYSSSPWYNYRNDIKSLALSGMTSIADRAFEGCSSLSSFSIPNSVSSIGDNAFAGCSNLTSLIIPNSVNGIGPGAFAGCSSLTSITLPLSVKGFYCDLEESGVFAGCSSLKSVTMPGVSRICVEFESGHFAGCSSLETVRMPQINYIYYRPYVSNFSGCSLSEVYVGTEPLGIYPDDVHYRWYNEKPPLKADGILYVPKGSRAIYQANEEWNSLYPNIEEYDLDDTYGMYHNAIYVEDEVVRSGGKVVLPLKMKNKETATGYEFAIVLPQGVDANDVVLTRSTERKADEVSFRYGVRDDGTIKVVGYSTDSQPFEGNDGEIATLTMTIPEDMDLGEQPLVIQEIEITNNGQPEVIYDQLITWLTVEDYLLGDANCDKRVSVSDLSIVVNHILNVNIDPEAPYNAKAADANEDKRVTVSDLSTIVNYIIYGNPDGPSEGKAREEEDAQSFYFSAPAFTINPGEESTLYLQLANSVDVTAFQFDAILPEGLTCTHAKRVAARVGEEHSFQSSLMDEQTRRVVCYSPSNANIEGNEGAIVELTIKAADNLQPGLYTLSLEGLEVVSHNQGMTLDNVALSIEVVDADGIEELQQDQTAKTRYDLMGRSTTRPQHGIYFENGRKVLVK